MEHPEITAKFPLLRPQIQFVRHQPPQKTWQFVSLTFHHLSPISTLPAMYQFNLELWGDHPINAITPDVWVKLVGYLPYSSIDLISENPIRTYCKIHHPGKAKRFTNVGVDPQIRESSRVNLWIHSSPFPISSVVDTVAFPRFFLIQWFHSSIYWRTNSRLDRLGCGVQKKQDGTSKKSARNEPSYYQTSMFQENH